MECEMSGRGESKERVGELGKRRPTHGLKEMFLAFTRDVSISM
jgi:hypothetical protein